MGTVETVEAMGIMETGTVLQGISPHHQES